MAPPVKNVYIFLFEYVLPNQNLNSKRPGHRALFPKPKNGPEKLVFFGLGLFSGLWPSTFCGPHLEEELGHVMSPDLDHTLVHRRLQVVAFLTESLKCETGADSSGRVNPVTDLEMKVLDISGPGVLVHLVSSLVRLNEAD